MGIKATQNSQFGNQGLPDLEGSFEGSLGSFERLGGLDYVLQVPSRLHRRK